MQGISIEDTKLNALICMISNKKNTQNTINIEVTNLVLENQQALINIEVVRVSILHKKSGYQLMIT